MDLELSEKIAFISGSSRGIGLEIAKTLNKEGCTVIINGRNQKSLDNALEELPNATSICADITSHKESKKVISEAPHSGFFSSETNVPCVRGSRNEFFQMLEFSN